MKPDIALEATPLHGSTYAVRPVGQLGTCGCHPRAWTVAYLTASSAADAILKHTKRCARDGRKVCT